MRSSQKSLPSFSGEDFLALSLVMHPRNLQLNPLPTMPLPTRCWLSRWPFGWWGCLRPLKNTIARSLHQCSRQALAGSDCVLLLRQLVLLGSRCRRKGEGCFSSNVSKVLFVKCEDYVRVSLSFMALSVFVTPPVLNECGPFGTLPC
jgi:hypothetical protein